jgi:cob(I)alamin adenosyltransferase
VRVKIYTRTGDTGETALFGGGRVSKDHPRTSAYGDVDELNSAIGVVRATAPEPEKVAKAIAKAVLPPERVASFEQAMDDAEGELPPLRAFVLPGGTPKAAALHLARTVCRRAERSVVRLAREDSAPVEILAYLNRLSDLLFTLARLANHRAGVGDITW